MTKLLRSYLKTIKIRLKPLLLFAGKPHVWPPRDSEICKNTSSLSYQSAIYRTLSSTLLLLSCLVIVEKEDSRYPSCFSVSESITHWTCCQLDNPRKLGMPSASFPVTSSYQHYTGELSSAHMGIIWSSQFHCIMTMHSAQQEADTSKTTGYHFSCSLKHFSSAFQKAAP